MQCDLRLSIGLSRFGAVSHEQLASFQSHLQWSLVLRRMAVLDVTTLFLKFTAVADNISAATHLKLARNYYFARIAELKELIAAEEAKFRYKLFDSKSPSHPINPTQSGCN